MDNLPTHPYACVLSLRGAALKLVRLAYDESHQVPQTEKSVKPLWLS